ncbi:MAG: YceI family protein [Bacteroidota bacterium]
MQNFIIIWSVMLLALSQVGTISAPPAPGQEELPIFTTANGLIQIRSDAPLELITAQSTAIRGALDPSNQTFAFTVQIRSFEGFNNPLQKEHFNENYMESARFPKAQFTGKIIESVPFTQPGEWVVRAKGMLEIHGVQKEQIIPVTISSDQTSLRVRTFFTVLLDEYQISVPKIVRQKIASEIEIKVEANLSPRQE